MWYTYLLHCADNTLYCGITTNLERRIQEHNGIRHGGAKYTRARRPVHLCTYTESISRSEATLLENHIRNLQRKDKIYTLQYFYAKSLMFKSKN